MPTKGKKLINTFRFQSFSERLGNVNIDIHRNEIITSKEIPENDKDTFFRESLEKWAELNCSLDFTEFYRKVKPLVQSFNQLVYHKDQVFEILKEYLSKKESLAHEACLELLTQLSKDLLDDFYVYFDQFFPLLVKFLDTNNAKLIENTFVCFAYIFKFLWRWMVKDLKKFFGIFSFLLSSTKKQHIQEFAAEAFAFLIRKSKDKSNTIKFLLGKVSDDLAKGIGYLLFYSVKGVKKQLCLNGDEFIKTLLNSIYLVSTDKDEIFQCLKVTWLACLKHLSPENADVLFLTLCESIKDFCVEQKKDCEILRCFICLLKETVEFKDGLFVNKRKIIKLLTEQLKVLANIKEIKEDLHLLMAKLILTYHGDLSDSEILDFVNDYGEECSELSDVIDFFGHFITWFKFSILKELVLRRLADHFVNIKDSTKILEFIIDVVFSAHAKSKLCKPFSLTLESEELLDFQSMKKKTKTHKVILKDLSLELWRDNPSSFWISVTVLTYLRFAPTKQDIVIVYNLINEILSQSLYEVSSHHLFGLAYCIQCYYVLMDRDGSSGDHPQVSLSLMKKLIKDFPSSDVILQAFELYIEFNKDGISREDIHDILDTIKENLNSPFKLRRLLALRIFDHFIEVISETEKDLVVFSYCIEAELIEPSLENYRNKLLHIQKLEQRTEDQYSKMVGAAILRYLIGNLFINLSVVWEPIVKVIVTFATDKSDYFWNVWLEILTHVGNLYGQPASKEEETPSLPSELLEVYQNLMQVIEKEKADQRPDHQNFRCLLWKAMAHFPSVVERRSRDLVPLFFQFMENEYTLGDELCLKTQNVSINKQTTRDVMDNAERKQKDHIKKNSKNKIKTLCSHLEVFKHFRDPKSLSKEKRLFQYYMEFLASKEHNLQQTALTCLQTYKFPYMKPYTENFEKLMDDTTFREELVKFSSEDESVYKPDHKEQLMPILIRLLFGKLHRKSGLGMGGKTSFSARRNVIMQFLANCNQKEIETFIHLIVDPLQLYKDMEILGADASVDITAIVPLQRQSSYCHMLSTVVSRLRKLVIPFMPALLRLLLRIIWSNTWCVLNKKEEIHPGILSRMKEIRTSGILRLIEIFNSMPEFDYQDFIEDIFAAVVWPKLKDLPMESCMNLSPLFQLIQCWSKHSRFIPLLSKQSKDGGDSLMSTMFVLMQHSSLNSEMEKQVMLVASNLLNAKDFVETEKDGKTIQVSQCFNDEEAIGIQIMKPYVPDLLEHLYNVLSTKTSHATSNGNSKKKIGHIIPHLQLSILATISKFTTDSDLCGKLIAIFFPVLHSIGSEDVQINIIQTVENLLPLVGSTSQYLSLVPPLFYIFKARKPRNILCEVYKKMCENEEQLKEISQYVQDMNSWDVKYLEEPNYERRLASYRKIGTLLADGRLENVENLLPFLYNCFHFVNQSTDMSLRDVSSSTIEAIVKMIAESEKKLQLFDNVIMKTVLPTIMQGFKLKSEIARHEHIHFLELLIKSFDNECFNDLRHLTTDDPETDFFQNIRHVQMHRRTRAIHKLTAVCEQKKLSNKSLHTLILPMISHVIFGDLAKSKDHNLLTGTIEAIGMIVRCFPWSKYSAVLKNYLKVLQKDKNNQKTIIRVVVAILNNFEFDLLNVKMNVDIEKRTKPAEAKKEEKAKTLKEKESKKKEKVEENKSEVEQTKDDNVSDDDDDDDDDNDVDENDDKSKTTGQNNQHIYVALTKTILPQLHKFFIKKSRYAYHHKLSHSKEEDEEEIMKVPVAVAMVKLLKHLPHDILLNHLSGILLRVSQALKSQAREVRDMARDTMKKIAASLGSSYLSLIIKEMKSVLLRGYQLHVLGFSVHAILESKQSEMKPGDLDGSVSMLMQIVTEELFGQVAEEKTIRGITVKLHEARSKKSNELIEIIAKYITSGSFALLVGPLKEVLDTTQDHKSRRKVEEAFRRISIGLQHNEGLSPEDTLLFIHGLVSNTLPAIFGQNKQKDGKQNKTEKGLQIVREDIYLMPDQPTRAGIVPAVSKLTNEHVLVEFGLQQLHTGLKRSKYMHSNVEHVRMLDPFVDILEKSLTSKHPRLVTLSVRAISLLVKFPLPSLKSSIAEIAKQIFKIIKKFARAGAAGKGENYEMILSSFKTMTTIIRDYKEFKVTDKQLQVLLAYVEEDIYDSQRQATALPLLKAIISRRLCVTEVSEIMTKIAQISIREEDSTTRLQCRQLMLMYMVEYKLGKKLAKQFDFYIANLTYTEETGRISALEMFAVMFNKFPRTILLEYASYFFLPLVMMLINDESALCRKMAGSAVKLLLTKVDSATRDDLFEIVLKWSSQENPQLRQISVQIIGMFVEVEGDVITARLPQIFPILTQILADGVAVDDDAESSDSEAEDDENEARDTKKEKDKVTDKCLYNALNCVGKIFAKLPDLILDSKSVEMVNEYMRLITELLLHSHGWVRLSAAQLFGLYFGHVSLQQIFNGDSKTYLAVDTKTRVKDLCLIFYEQLKDEKITKDIADQATKNLIYITKLVRHIDDESKVPSGEDKMVAGEVDIDEDQEEIDDERKIVTMKMIVSKMNRLASFEASQAIKNTIKRTCVFRWIAAICLEGSLEQNLPYLQNLLRPLHREISASLDEESELTKLANEVVELIRSQMDKQLFAEIYSKVQKRAYQARETRKRKLKVEAVTDPEKFAKRKQKATLAKKEQKKRKLYEKKPELKFKKLRSKPTDY